MKRLSMLVALPLLFIAPCTFAFDAVSSGGIGYIMQDQAKSELGYFVGFGAPVVTKKEAGYTLKNETSYLYSGYTDAIKAVRILAINQKNVWSDTNGGFYISAGAGTWAFLQSGENSESETLGTLVARIGAYWKFIDLQISCESIQKPGADLFFPSVGVSLQF